MQALIETLMNEKRCMGPCGVSEVKQVASALWITVTFLYLYLAF